MRPPENTGLRIAGCSWAIAGELTVILAGFLFNGALRIKRSALNGMRRSTNGSVNCVAGKTAVFPLIIFAGLRCGRAVSLDGLRCG